MVVLYSLALFAALSYDMAYFFSLKKTEDQHVMVTMLYVESIKV